MPKVECPRVLSKEHFLVKKSKYSGTHIMALFEQAKADTSASEIGLEPSMTSANYTENV